MTRPVARNLEQRWDRLGPPCHRAAPMSGLRGTRKALTAALLALDQEDLAANAGRARYGHGAGHAVGLDVAQSGARHAFGTMLKFVVDGDELVEDVTDAAFDVNGYMDRFEKIAGSKYAPDSLNAYRRRFKRAVELYRQYIEQGAANFKAPVGRTVRKRPVKENGANGGTGSAALTLQTTNNAPPAAPDLIDYPFPLRSGQIAHLHLPARLEKDDADRMAILIRALVFEPQPQIEPAEEPS